MKRDIEELIRKAKKNDTKAFGTLYELFYKRIYRFVYYMIYDPHISQDLVQTIFVKTWKSLPSFEVSKGTFQAFIFAIARNTVIDYQRKKKVLAIDSMDSLPSNENIEDKLVSQQQKKILYKTLSYLKPIEKQLIVLRYFEELSIAEVASVVRKEEGAVRVRIHRILRKMKEYIAENVYAN